jgi:hypothetical protein
MSGAAPLSYRATLEEYEQQAQALFEALQSEDQAAEWRVKWEHPRFRGKSIADVRAATLDVADAQRVVAREYGFDQWADMAEFAEAVRRDGPVARFEAAAQAVVSGETESLRLMLAEPRSWSAAARRAATMPPCCTTSPPTASRTSARKRRPTPSRSPSFS